MKQTFDEVIKECNNEENFIISPDCKTENKGFFTCLRVDRSTVPDGWYVYEIRHGSRGLLTVEPNVCVDHAGTFITKKELKLGDDNCHHLKGRGGYTYC